jgi:membrane fusion protein (multidrug efflux system)
MESEVSRERAGEASPRGKRGRRKYWIAPLVLVVVILAGGPYAYGWWRRYITTEHTDNATVQGRVVSLSSRIGGNVVGVEVVDNQRVKEGDVLILLDQRDLQIGVQQAEAALELAVRQAEVASAGIGQSATQALAQDTQAQGGVSLATTSIEVARAAVDAARAGVASAEARLVQAQTQCDQARQDYERSASLAGEGVISRQQLEHAELAYDVAAAALESAHNDVILARSRLQQAELSVGIAEAQRTQSEGAVQNAEASAEQTDVRRRQYEAALAQVDVARAALEAAQLQLSYATISAPSDGRLGKVAVQVGQRVSAGQPLMPLVLDGLWVVANFKETQVDRIRPGLPTEIRVDAYPGRVFAGHVDSISPASGATFALLPPENATGNFTKVVQRIPVKIMFEPGALAGYEDLLEPGMSVTVRVVVSYDNARPSS